MLFGVVGAVVVGALLLGFIIFKLMWRVAEPNEALVISGLRQQPGRDEVGESLGFKIVTGKGTLVLPGVQAVRRHSLDLREAKLGLIVDSLQIQEIEDLTGYMTNLGKPHAAAVASLARIAEAHADREATQQEQDADAPNAEARRNASIKQAGFQAEIDQAASRAKQAGPLAEAGARQE